MLYLVDASVFVFRAYYSVPMALVDRDGNPVNALHGFARFIGDLMERVRPEHMAVAFDESLVSSFRNQLYPAYKANREPAPEDLKRQFALCRRLCEALGVATFSSNRYEADDIIGTLAVRMRALGKRVVLVTRDKDLAQLVRPGDAYWDYIGDARFAYEDITERFGVLPERMPCFLALMGDAVDNIPGVPGVGRKTASMLFRHFESLFHLYDDLESVLKLKLRNAGFVVGQLRDYRERAFLARKLTEIACDMPLDVELAHLARRPPDLRAVCDFYDSVGFGRLLRNQAERLAAS
ncbi:MAG: 5'-3' exonuclease H3TH domain-containing protein [Steroidobacteraceae bacterium]|jgi:5'-3' exonuclease|nr:5'-3' exonuclease H3TH domain-containing protein [Steroidobacteraceae bacterium]